MVSKPIGIFFVIPSLLLCVYSLDVKTSSGIVRGQTIQVINKSVNQFLNIPYAEPPIGKLRFSKPVALREPKKFIIDGTKIGNSCYQNDPKLINSEDCLVLNVWSPVSKNSSSLKPVMFWIYGGSYTSGSIFFNFYDGRVLATHDVVFVSVNYRLGPFGWLYGGEESAPGNVGLYDQKLALNWVKQNIHLFGGDPNQVTIFGESAGSWSVSAHVLSPLSAGLFKKAILQSGSIMENKNTPSLSKSAALSQSKLMAKHFNCSDDNKWLDCLRGIDAKVLNNYYALRPWIIFGTDILPFNAQKAINSKKYNSGVVKDEAASLSAIIFPPSHHLKSGKEFLDFVKSIGYPELNMTMIKQVYLNNINTNSTKALINAFNEFIADIQLKCPTYFFAKQFADNTPKRNAFFYKWTYPPHIMAPILGCTKEMGVCHATDIEYVFGLPVFMNTSDKNFSEDVMKMWTNFAKNGNPMDNFPTGYRWPRISEAGPTNKLTKVKEINPTQPNHILENPFKTCDENWASYFN